ncbi:MULTISPECIES: sugar ABC transporter ATP-binding protein [unclassified Streptomyces]|uniref:sugar ABC transporter ATP-binding protein n=1 Tax=unclassified Streptomyces TaxID=2593676 RepID=UPI00081E30AB|nr:MULTISPECIES: sugar ABC transporter ATP-binding protein [unclassified Streptomyces]MYZ36447.1 ATP-binding cassette domain-containing protein [Streptomyces sp. SID4917]SCF83625.1 monosaccharide ABC transporter ATP-binding protein, CUT2 family [Streptomyces sp. MnatMP-M17]
MSSKAQTTTAQDVLPSAVLSISHLSKTFPGVKALDSVDLDVRRGQIHALVGQNGSGKSTLIKILAGVHTPDDPAPSATVEGHAFHLGDAHSAHKAGLRFVHQDLGLVPNLSSIDNLALGFGYATGATGRIRWKEQRARAERALQTVIDDFPLRRNVGTLSVFQQTALAIARALQDWDSHGSLLVLDEPTAAMPRAQVEHLFDLLKAIRARGTSVLLVTHHLEEVFAIADRVTVLRDGSVVADQALQDLNAAGLTTLMTGEQNRRAARRQRSEPGPVALHLRGVSGETLQPFHLEVRRGEIVGVAGLNGSGREEVCELVFGARKRTGTVDVAGTPLAPNRPDVAIKSGVGMVPAHRHRDGLVMTQSVRNNLTLAGLDEFRGKVRIRTQAERETAASWVHRLGVKTTSTETPVAALSGGNQQKVVIGKWLRLEPAVLLLDEPTQGVDVAAQADLHALLTDAAAKGTALLVCSSDEVELSKLCDRVIVLRSGQVATELRGSELTPQHIVTHSLTTDIDASTTSKP